MPVLEKCFEPFSDEEAFANLPKNIFGERRENKLQTTFWPGTDEGCRQREGDVSLPAAALQAGRSENASQSWLGLRRAPRLSLTQGEGDSPEK